MLSLRAHTSAANVMSYYATADYYLGSAGNAEQAAQWCGNGAQRLGLDGPAGRVEFHNLLEGRLPSGQQLGAHRGGEIEHRPCWDLTFSAPKSVSVMALVGEDKRLLTAHDQSVRAALGHLEARIAQTRIRENGEVRSETTGNLIVATLREETSRASDPQLHSHNVVMNITQSKDGQWRSLDGYAFFQSQREVGQLYRNELALRVQALGYQITPGKDGTFELSAVPREVVQAFSTRSGQVEQALAERGLTRDTASAAQKDALTLATRSSKPEQGADALRAEWQARAAEHGFNVHASATAARQASSAVLEPGRHDAAASLAVASAMATLAEREAVFGERSLRQEALQAAVGKARLADVERAIAHATERGELIPRTLERDGRSEAGYTTPQGIQTEQRMLVAELAGRQGAAALLSSSDAHRVVAQHELRGPHAWTQGQRMATAALLGSGNRVDGMQGYAGTAKTTTVLAAVSEVAARQGYEVIALAPTASAAQTLGDAIGRPSMTVSRHLAGMERAQDGKPQWWIVDEASMLSARQMAQVLEGAQQAGARVLLVGDVQQLGSVDAGAAFRQLQDAGMRTVVLDQIVRQTNAEMREGVYAAIRGDAKAALAAIERGGGQVREVADIAERREAIARDFAALSPQERGRTLVLDPSREGREALTEAIRDRFKTDGTLHGHAVRVDTLENKRLTQEQARQAFQYETGDQVRFRSDYAAGIERGAYYRVAGVDAQAGTVTLADRQGMAVTWTPAQWGSSTVEAYAVIPREVMAGDRLAWTKNDQAAGRVNGRTVDVLRVESDGRITVHGGRGTQTLDPAQPGDGHFRHDYVATVHAAQGQTAERVMINAESYRTQLLNESSFYVAISRAKDEVRVYTDSVRELTKGIEERTGEKTMALQRGAEASPSSGVDGVRSERGAESQASQMESGKAHAEDRQELALG
jgi:conjugative relaxase-like TrwC/TraI family protein